MRLIVHIRHVLFMHICNKNLAYSQSTQIKTNSIHPKIAWKGGGVLGVLGLHK